MLKYEVKLRHMIAESKFKTKATEMRKLKQQMKPKYLEKTYSIK
jgi:hypothetical protein